MNQRLLVQTTDFAFSRLKVNHCSCSQWSRTFFMYLFLAQIKLCSSAMNYELYQVQAPAYPLPQCGWSKTGTAQYMKISIQWGPCKVIYTCICISTDEYGRVL
jgi:hypothetical protein